MVERGAGQLSVCSYLYSCSVTFNPFPQVCLAYTYTPLSPCLAATPFTLITRQTVLLAFGALGDRTNALHAGDLSVSMRGGLVGSDVLQSGPTDDNNVRQ